MDLIVRGLNPSEEEELFLTVFILIILFLNSLSNLSLLKGTHLYLTIISLELKP